MMWGSMCRKFERDFKQVVWHVKYEDFILNPQKTARDLMIYLNAAKWDMTDRVIDIIHKHALKRWRNTDEFKNSIGKEMLRYYKYE